MFYGPKAPGAHILLLELCETMRNYTKLCETKRNYAKLCETNAQFRANVSICTCVRIEYSLPEFARPARPARGAGGARGNRVTESCSDPPSHTRRGLGLREFHKLPQKILRIVDSRKIRILECQNPTILDSEITECQHVRIS